MIAVKVTYVVEEGYIGENLSRIAGFLADFKHLDQSRFQYDVLHVKGSPTFVHVSRYKDQEVQQEILGNTIFRKFQEERDKRLVGEPLIEYLDINLLRSL